MQTHYERKWSYEDITLKPQKCIVGSRKDCDTSVELGSRVFDMPVIPANMKSVVDEGTCKYLAENNWFYIMHRFGVDPVDFCKRMMRDGLFTSISMGINGDSFTQLKALKASGICPDYITIDVANAWSGKCHSMVDYIKEEFPNSFLIVGNVATMEATQELGFWGADAIKVGIAGGSVCITKDKTGFSYPMVSTIEECALLAGPSVPIIADGGVRKHGDIAKALVLGATMVMAGSLFAGYDQSAGNVIDIEDTTYKEYFGSASHYNKNEHQHVEGKKILIKYRGSMDKLLQELKEDLQSSISYGGGDKCDDLMRVKMSLVSYMS